MDEVRTAMEQFNLPADLRRIFLEELHRGEWVHDPIHDTYRHERPELPA